MAAKKDKTPASDVRREQARQSVCQVRFQIQIDSLKAATITYAREDCFLSKLNDIFCPVKSVGEGNSTLV